MKQDDKFAKNNMIKDGKIVNLINTLSDSIKEYYKVTKNVNRNEIILMNIWKQELNNCESIMNNILNEGFKFNSIDFYNNSINQLTKILEKIHLNIQFNEKNLSFFFEDAKILFKKLKEQRQELVLNIQRRGNSTSGRREAIFHTEKKRNNAYINSDIQAISNSLPNENRMTFRRYSLKNNNLFKNKNTIAIDWSNKKARSHEKQSANQDEIFEEVKYGNNNSALYKEADINNKDKEIERLDNLNKKYLLYIKKLNIELKKYQSQKNTNLITYTENKSKDKLISSLKENIKLNNLKYNQLMDNLNNSNNLVKHLTDENRKLKSNSPALKNNDTKNSEQNRSFIIKINNLLKENNILKNKIEKMKQSKTISNSDFNLNLKSNSIERDSEITNTSYIKEIQFFKKKVLSIEKKLADEQKKNSELINENKLLKKYQSDLSQISKKNNEISKLLSIKQNELVKLQKENNEKNKELEAYKNNKNEKPKNNFGDNFNKIIEDFNKEKSNLMTENNTLQDKINYYKTQIKKIKKELYEKIQANIELQINNDKKISDMKDDFNQKIEELNNKNKNLENDLEKCQNFNNELNQQINDLNQQIISKDIKNLELNYQIEQIEKNAANKEQGALNDNKNNSNDNQQINSLKSNIEELKLKNNDLSDKLNKVKKDNEILAEKILGYEKGENASLKDNRNNNEEIEKIKKENKLLKNNNERLSKEIKEILNNNILNDTNSEIIKSQSEELEGLKKLIFQFETERKKSDNEIKTLKKENEKMQNQLIRLSKSLPEEYNELLKEFKDLSIKYKNLLKNKNNTPQKEESLQSSSNKTKNNKNNEHLTELNKAKKEIEIIKKKNMELVKQLEEKEINKDCYDNKSEQNVSNYEEEFDLKKMAKGARDKNRSQDINIDYPGIQAVKERYRELDFYYNSLEGLVKKLLLTINCTPKNKTYVNELCKIVGFDLDTTNKILTNKNKNFILGLFNK